MFEGMSDIIVVIYLASWSNSLGSSDYWHYDPRLAQTMIETISDKDLARKDLSIFSNIF